MNNAIDKNINNFHKGFLTTDRFSDPTYLGFKLVFDFNPVTRNPETGQTDDPLFSEDAGLESAIRYLKSTGYPNRAIMLQEFKKLLQKINTDTPWYWQSLNGLNDIWKIEFGEAFNPFRGKDKALEITCLESIDLRITALADLYRKATFDTKFMRALLPENLRWFTLKVQLAEMRSFQKINDSLKISTTVVNENPNTESLQETTKQANGLPLEDIENLISLMEFHLSHCTFDFWESFPSDKEISMAGDFDMSKQKFKIRVGHVQEKHSYKILDLVLKDGTTQENGSFKQNIPDFDTAINRRSGGLLSNNLQGVASQLQDRLNQIAGVPANLVARGVNQLTSAVTAAQLGNVYDARNQALQTVINGFVNKNDQIGNVLGKEDVFPNNPGSDSETKSAGNMGNVY